MKPSPPSTFLPLIALALTTSAQSLSDVPSCASTLALASFTSTGCPLTEIACICQNQGFLTSLLPVVESACSPEKFQKTLAFTEKLCKDDGVPLSITISASSATTSATSRLPAASASGTGGSLNPGNSTAGGKPTTPTLSPAAAPGSGAAAIIVNMGVVVGSVLVGAIVVGGLL